MKIKKKERSTAISVLPAAIMRPRSWKRKPPTRAASVSPTTTCQYSTTSLESCLDWGKGGVLRRSSSVELHVPFIVSSISVGIADAVARQPAQVEGEKQVSIYSFDLLPFSLQQVVFLVVFQLVRLLVCISFFFVVLCV